MMLCLSETNGSDFDDGDEVFSKLTHEKYVKTVKCNALFLLKR